MTAKPTIGETALQRAKPTHVAACLNLSHELRTPANAILGQVELLLTGSAGPLTSEMRESLGDIQRAAMDMSTQIGKVISVAEDMMVPRSVPTGE